MRWAAKDEGSWRIIWRFAFFPTKVSLPTRQIVWLEFYKVNQQCINCEWVDMASAVREYWG